MKTKLDLSTKHLDHKHKLFRDVKDSENYEQTVEDTYAKELGLFDKNKAQILKLKQKFQDDEDGNIYRATFDLVAKIFKENILRKVVDTDYNPFMDVFESELDSKNLKLTEYILDIHSLARAYYVVKSELDSDSTILIFPVYK
ncbi:MAG: hypothetical protein JKY37_03470 [Nannocystaceae bacterium]|nr:hypothetical protein [Nannocystaceae bacterium]